ncbi:hypothetical protein M513_11277 [Trichuris suis]|uniref:Uncharacterized protein n=1 Tax=Trichuris suis TaxID=68888 RepID=A0A085LSB7_9BILA|nr:hypothetical protein M513_11277 [Trichuris suis]
MVVSGHDDLAYFLLVKVGSLVLTTLLVMITCLRCVGRNRLRVTAGFWRPDCYKKSRQRTEADEVDAANHTTSRPSIGVPRTRPLSDFAPFSRTVRPEGLERSRSNSEIYAYVGKQQYFGHYWSNVCSNPMQYDVPAYSQILENDGQTSDEVYSQMHGHEFYDNIRDLSPDNERWNKAVVNSYDYPKFSPLPLKSRPAGTDALTSKQQCANGSCFEPHLYSAIRSAIDLDTKDNSSFPLHRSRLSRSHIGICAEPLYSVIQKQTPFMGRTVYVSGRMFPYSDPYIGRIGDLGAGGGSNSPVGLPSSPEQVVPRTRQSEMPDEMPSCNYRYLSMREPLDVLRRRLEQQNGRNFFNSASDSSLHYYTSINESSDPGYEAWRKQWCCPSNVLLLPVEQPTFNNPNSSAKRPSNSTGIYDNIREMSCGLSSCQPLVHSSPGRLGHQHWLVLNVGGVTSSSDSDLYTEFDGSRVDKSGQRRSLGD